MLTLDISDDLCQEFAIIAGWTKDSGLTPEEHCCNVFYADIKNRVSNARVMVKVTEAAALEQAKVESSLTLPIINIDKEFSIIIPSPPSL